MSYHVFKRDKWKGVFTDEQVTKEALPQEQARALALELGKQHKAVTTRFLVVPEDRVGELYDQDVTWNQLKQPQQPE